MENSKEIKRNSINEVSAGQYALYQRKPKIFSPKGPLVVSLPIRPSDYSRFACGTFVNEPESEVSVAFLDICRPGDIVCLQTADMEGAWLLSNKGWKKLSRFSPKDLPWKN